MIECRICGESRDNLTKHIKAVHGLSVSEYGGVVIDPAVVDKRRATCEAVYGDRSYRNQDAINLSNEVFEGGHSLRDPAVREKAKETKRKLYGNPNFTNRVKAIETRKALPEEVKKETIKKRNQTLLAKYGRVFNHVKTKLPVPDDFRERFSSTPDSHSLCIHYGASPILISRWVKECGLSWPKVSPDREYQTPVEVVRQYFERCEGKALSFYDYGRKYGNAPMLKMKRMFNAGGKYSALKSELFVVALDKGQWEPFLKEIS